MDCCSSANYMDYRHHSMNSNFCYPYTPSMLRSVSPYPLASPVGGPGRYGTDGAAGYHRSSALGYASSMGYPHDGYDKYYGGYHHHSTAASGHGSIGGGGYGASGYYGSYSSSAYRGEYGGYGHYYSHQSQSPYSRSYGAGTTGAGAAYLYPGRHYPGSGSLAPQHPGFARGDSYLYHHPQQRGEQPQYSSFASYGSIPTPFRSSLGSGGDTTSDPPSAKSPYATSSPGFTTTGSSHLERPVAAASALPSAPSGVNSSSAALDSAARSPSASLFPNGYSPSSGYSPLSASYGPTAADDSPQLPLQPDPDEGDARRDAAAAAVRGATEFSPDGDSPKEARGTRKPKERKLQQQQRGMMYGGQTNGTGAGGRSSSSAGSRASSPTAAAAASASARMKSLDALTNLCWPDGEQFSSKMRKYSNASGLKSKDGANSRKQDVNDHELSAAASPSRTTGTGRRAKKQTKQQKELKSSDGKEKQANSAASVTSVPPVENKNVTPLPGFQQAFGSTEIGKFSEVFFNSSPTPNESSPSQHHHAMHHPQQQQQQLQHQQQRIQQQQQQQQQQHHHGAVQQLVMDSLNAYESDVDTLSPQSWEPPPAAAAPAPTESYEGCTGYNHLQIGTSFHPSYFESSSYSDHAVDSPLGSYFSEMTCNEFVN